MAKQTQTLKGFRDFLPEEMAIRQKVIDTLKEVFESYGYAPLETPSLEYAETLLGKYGEEADKLVYTFKDKGERDIGLIYDLTVPASKVLALYSQDISLPFKRYQIQRIWRAEKPQKGRYREVLQCDVDSFGTTSPLADAEIVAIISQCLKKLNFKKFTIRINSRQVLFKLMKDLGISQEKKQFALFQSLDKLKKMKTDEVKKELKKKGFSQEKIEKLFSLIKSVQPDENLKQLFNYLKQLGIEEKEYQFDPSLVRGLDYYTGPIFETYVEEPKIGSITGGGRYDKLVADLGGPDIPATGTTIGLDRICEVIKEKKLMPEITSTPIKVLVTIFSPELLKNSIEMVNQLRKAKINTELYLDPDAKLDKQLKYADKKGIPFVIILGPEEIKKKMITLRNMKAKSQVQLTLQEVIEKLS
ncbi:MAG: histidine--tRNA ligase [Candidatus Marinimicrobia bacterium]|nr:histidine--tRNA ligase [Candidatus Neomarinimicrobiota bacterium]